MTNQTDDKGLRSKISGYWHKARCQWADSDYSVVCDCHLEIEKLIHQQVREARIDEVGRIGGGYSFNMRIKSVRTSNTAFKLYAVKFFNGVMEKRRETRLAELNSLKKGGENA